MEDQNTEYKKALAKKLINTDSLAEAEKITGDSYKTSDETSFLGLALQVEKSKRVNAILSELNDTLFSNTETDYLKKVTEFGFEVALKLPFVNNDGITERFYILFHKRLGILLTFDTHTWGDDGSWAKAGKEVPPSNVNGGKFYYNWSPNPKINRAGLTGSGGFMFKNKDRFATMFDNDFNEINQNNLNIPADIDWFESTPEQRKVNNEEINAALDKVPYRLVWVGDHDCREALKMNVTNLIHNGVFLAKWKKSPFLWLLHYMDTKTEGYDYEKINAERIAMLPEYVRNAINAPELD